MPWQVCQHMLSAYCFKEKSMHPMHKNLISLLGQTSPFPEGARIWSSILACRAQSCHLLVRNSRSILHYTGVPSWEVNSWLGFSIHLYPAILPSLGTDCNYYQIFKHKNLEKFGGIKEKRWTIRAGIPWMNTPRRQVQRKFTRRIPRTNKKHSSPSKQNINVPKTQCTLLMRLWPSR